MLCIYVCVYSLGAHVWTLRCFKACFISISALYNILWKSPRVKYSVLYFACTYILRIGFHFHALKCILRIIMYPERHKFGAIVWKIKIVCTKMRSRAFAAKPYSPTASCQNCLFIYVWELGREEGFFNFSHHIQVRSKSSASAFTFEKIWLTLHLVQSIGI